MKIVATRAVFAASLREKLARCAALCLGRREPARIRLHEAWLADHKPQALIADVQGLAPDLVARLELDGDAAERVHGGDLAVEPVAHRVAEDLSSIAHLWVLILAEIARLGRTGL